MTSTPASQHGQPIRLFTIGFTGKTAEEFFQKLQQAGVRRLIDVRLNNVSQLAGFTKKHDLEYFLRVIARIDYTHEVELAPTKEILDDYRRKRINWPEYEQLFHKLLQGRRPADHLRSADLDGACLMCSEKEPDQCHRRLVAEYLQRHWSDIVIRHL